MQDAVRRGLTQLAIVRVSLLQPEISEAARPAKIDPTIEANSSVNISLTRSCRVRAISLPSQGRDCRFEPGREYMKDREYHLCVPCSTGFHPHSPEDHCPDKDCSC